MSLHLSLILASMLISHTTASITANDCDPNAIPEITNKKDIFNCTYVLKPTNSSIEINLNIRSNLLRRQTPYVITRATLLGDETYSSGHNFLDVVAYTDSGQSLWRYSQKENGRKMFRYLYMDMDTTQGSKNAPQSIPVKILVSSTAKQDISFTISVKLRLTSIQLDKIKHAKLTTDSALLYRFSNENGRSRRIRVRTYRENVPSSLDITEGCSIVAIQRLDIPFNDHERDITFNSLWQTMLGLSVIDLDVGKTAETPFADGFFVVILKKSNESDCEKKNFDYLIDGRKQEMQAPFDSRAIYSSIDNDDGRGRQDISIHISELDNEIDFRSWIIVGVFIGILVITVVSQIGYFYGCCGGVLRIPITGTVLRAKDGTSMTARDDVNNGEIKMQEYITKQNNDNSRTVAILNAEELTKETTNQQGPLNIEEAMKKCADLATLCDPSLFPKSLEMRDNIYCWVMLLSGIFYVLPAIQLMLGAQRISKQTGSLDMCYYNYLCRYTCLGFDDYGLDGRI